MVPDPPQPWIPGPEDPAPTVPVEGWGDFETTLRPRDPEDAMPVLGLQLLVGSASDPAHAEHDRGDITDLERAIIGMDFVGRTGG